MTEEEIDQPPVFAKWRNWYWLVMMVLAVQILIYLFITNSFQ